MNMNIESYLRNSKKVDLSDIDTASAADFPLTPEEARCLTYMMDVESHTIMYLRGLLNTCAVDDPEIAAFLPCWAYEELFHGRALQQFLEACGVCFAPGRSAEVRNSASLSERIQEAGASLLCRFTPHLTAAYLTWGAVQELSTLEGYGLLERSTHNPILAEILRRIIKDERRHFAFYYNKAKTYLAPPAAQRLTSFLLRRFWNPVGQGIKSAPDTRWMLQFLFAGGRGLDASRRIDSAISRLPGLAWFDLFGQSRRSAVAAAV